MNLKDIWFKSKKTIEKHFEGTQKSHFLKKLSYFEHGDDWICFLVPTFHDGEYIEKVIWGDITNILLIETGFLIQFRFTTRSLKSTASHQKNTRILERIPPDKTFDNFVVGECNKMAYAAASAIAEALGDSDYNPLYIYGDTGLGKTHLMYAIANYVANKDPKITPLYTTVEEFMNEMIFHIQSRKTNRFQQKYRSTCDLLLMDDIQFLSKKARTQEEIFNTFEYLKNHGIQIVFTSDVLPKDIEKLEPRLRTRFGSGMLVDMSPPDLETMVAIVKQKAIEKSLMFPNDVALYIAQSFGGNVREAEGAINRLKMYTSLENIPVISLQFAKKHLNPMIMEEKKSHTSSDDIIKSVAATFHIRESDIKGKSRKKTIASPRHIAIYLVRKHTELSLSEIGKQFGGRDHSTVISSCSKIEKMLKTNPNLSGQIEVIERNL